MFESRWDGKRFKYLIWGLTGLFVLLYFVAMAFKGWIPHDEGTLGNSAERVLHGMVPHTDFVDPYTGGLSYLHALSFKLFGVSIWSMRFILLLFSLVSVLVAARVFRSLLTPGAAALLTLLAAAWMTPMYFAGLSSWYVTFCGVGALACFLRYNQSGNRALLVVAGGLCGLSFLVKISGLYLICALVAGLIFVPSAKADGAATGPKTVDLPVRSLRLLAAVGISGMVVLLIWKRLHAAEFLLFALPGCAVCMTGIIAEFRNNRPAERLGDLLRELALVCLGVAVPIALFCLFLYDLDGLKDLYHGLFVLPFGRLEFSVLPPPGVWEYVFVIPYALLLGASIFAPTRPAPKWLLLLTILVLAVLISVAPQARAYDAIWGSLRPMIPLTVVFACVALLRFNDRPQNAKRNLFAATCALAFCSLVQFPVTHGIYFCYVAVFLIMALATLIRFVGLSYGRLHLSVAAFFLLFAVMLASQNPPYNQGERVSPLAESYDLQNPRGGIQVNQGEGLFYDFLVHFIQERTEGDTFIFAGPDSPEVYFLTGKQNLMPFEYDFFFQGTDDDLLAMIDEAEVNLAVINTMPEFSYPYSADLISGLEQRFPNSRVLSKYRVLWRE